MPFIYVTIKIIARKTEYFGSFYRILDPFEDVTYEVGRGWGGKGGGIRISVCLGWMNPQDGLECVFQPAPPILKQNDDAALIQNCFHSQLKIGFVENM